MAKIIIIGNNLSGDGMWHFFKDYHDIQTYDNWSDDKETLMNYDLDLAIICTDAPINKRLTRKPKINEMRFDSSLIEEVINWCQAKLIIIASTVEPGTTDRIRLMTNKKIVYLNCEKNAFIFGGNPQDTKEAVELFAQITKSTHRYIQADAKTCEMFKYAKAIYEAKQKEIINNINSICKSENIDSNQLREIWLTIANVDPLEISNKEINNEIVQAFNAYANFVDQKK